ncbi:hypothetical protein CICLE_v10017578mg [Citrus x clementina]|uniref:Uncharacterized protein n=1 Tax=Citrus clementina TaxID=85681 RepID=V4UAX1_CITCL|nr:hypothetical protein CICLE_v10017578mg [Citrus x clementina]
MEEERKLLKEQERERRRLRDRQRRQSMSVEEREKHLARRRKNYQLRRLRAENAQLDLDQPQSQATTSTNQLTTFPSVSSDLDSGSHLLAKSESLEVPAHKLAKFSGQLRLSQLKQLARSINNSLINNHKVAVDVTINSNESSGVSPKGLRLNRVKHLARSLNSTVKESASQNQQAK